MTPQDLLSALQDDFVRTESESTCPPDCNVPEDPPKVIKGVTYKVLSGELQGEWSEWGDDAEERIFERMVGKLDESWRTYLERYSRVASAMRAVGR